MSRLSPSRWYAYEMSKQRSVRIAVALGMLAGWTGAAHADHGRQVRYIGVHPISKDHGGGLCYIEGPHVHAYAAPSAKLQFRDHRGANFFSGDPVAYGWDGPRHAYMGNHPIYIDAVLGEPEPHHEFCFLNGPHFHAFAPPPAISADFRMEGNAYFFIGTPPPTYVEVRPAMAEINAVYEPIVYQRPVVTVTPPQAWIGIRFPVVAVEHPRVRGYGHAGVNVGVVAPAVSVDVALPSVSIGVGAAVGVGVGVGAGGVVHGGGGGYAPGRKFKHGDRGWHRGGRHD